MNKQFSHAASIFPVDDPLTTAHFYRDQLGFDIHFVWGEPAEYVVTNREDSVSIHFVKIQDNYQPSHAHIALYIFVYDVDRLYRDLQSKAVDIINPVGTREWGMRDFDIKDPNGFILTFGTHVDQFENN